MLFSVWVWDGVKWLQNYAGDQQWTALTALNSAASQYRFYAEYPPDDPSGTNPTYSASMFPGQRWDPFARKVV